MIDYKEDSYGSTGATIKQKTNDRNDGVSIEGVDCKRRDCNKA
jgi:hypothetical protein